jgi:hypothetical protein
MISEKIKDHLTLGENNMPLITVPISLILNLCILIVVAPIGYFCKLILKGIKYE